MFGSKKKVIEIVYKSGHVRRVKCDAWNAEWEIETSRVVALTITGLTNPKSFFGVNNIESIWEIV